MTSITRHPLVFKAKTTANSRCTSLEPAKVLRGVRQETTNKVQLLQVKGSRDASISG